MGRLRGSASKLHGILSNYCGLGGEGIPAHKIDYICQRHDARYEAMLQRGEDPYWQWNKADEKMLHQIQHYTGDDNKLLRKIAETWLQTKRTFLEDIGEEKEEPPITPRTETANKLKQLSLINSTSQDNMAMVHVQRHGKRQKIRDPISENRSTQTEHQGEKEQGNMEGGENQITKPHHIWRRFPNTDTACLKWVSSNFLTDLLSTAQGTTAPETRVSFDQNSVYSTTDLLTSGGGALLGTTGASINGPYGKAVPSSGHDYTNPVQFVIRMTTPYNIMSNLNGSGLQNNNNGNSQPAWLELFDTKYQFYHQMECEWELTLTFGKPFYLLATLPTTINSPEQNGYYIFWKYFSNDTPPISYSINNTNIANIAGSSSGGTNTTGLSINAQGTQQSNVAVLSGGAITYACTPDDYFRMEGFHHKHVMLNSTHSTRVTIEGHYKFGQCKMDIKTQVPGLTTPLQTEGWAQTGATVAFPENLCVIIVQDNAINNQTGYLTPVGYRWETEHLIQFKDLRSAFKFPTPANANTNSATTLNTEAMFFNRGAAYS